MEYANKRRLAQPTSQLMVRVNLAQTYKWQDDPGKCNEILDGQDWRSCSANFKLCVVALKDDYKTFYDNLKIAMQEKSITLEDLYEWPVFQSVRKKEEFKEDVKNIFGSDYDENDIQNKPVLLDFESEKKLSDMLGKFQKADELAPVSDKGK